MVVLIKLFDSPVNIYEKMKRDYSSLDAALSQQNRAEVRDALFNFSVSAYHVIDWVQAYRPELKEKLSSVRKEVSIKIIRDVCNASKHVELDENSSAYKKFPAEAESVETSATSATSLMGSKSKNASNVWVLKVVTKSGSRKRFEDVAKRAIDILDEFFRDNGLLKNDA